MEKEPWDILLTENTYPEDFLKDFVCRCRLHWAPDKAVGLPYSMQQSDPLGPGVVYMEEQKMFPLRLDALDHAVCDPVFTMDSVL
ncbi:hypothetical protein SK128_012934 [Halocaridina rubra]|uniref:Uncharacterized protein n=1 Tax=Halocaridina rubra TaxID=373956 RepID=A0AAN8WP00_HALRR